MRTLEKEPKVSVIMPTYNGGHFLKEALFSILEQDYKNMEIIVCDDSSKDNTREIIQEIKQERDHNNQMQIITQTHNQGISRNMNTGLEAASGKYIAILDQDDKWLNPDKLTQQVRFLEGNINYGIVGTNTLVDIGGTIIKNYYPTEDTEIRKVILGKCPMLHSSVMYHKSLASQIGGYSNKCPYTQDYDLFLKIIKESKGSNLVDNMTYYIMHNANISSLKTREQKISALKLARENRHNFPNITKALIYRTGNVILSTLLPNTDCFKKVELLVKSNY